MDAFLSAQRPELISRRQPPFSNTADSKAARGDLFLSASRSMTRIACRLSRSIKPQSQNLIIVLLNVSQLMTR
jgi:hypothetical protein